MSNVTFVVLFTNTTEDTTFLSQIADWALLEKKTCIHARASADAIIPSYCESLAFRELGRIRRYLSLAPQKLIPASETALIIGPFLPQ